ncbi:MAG: glycerol-3-phosphate acyltransferase [Aestuariivirga sp.]
MPGQILLFVTGVAVAYALGCFSTSYYYVRLVTGSDIRQEGSSTAGARNVSRLLGRKAGIVVAVADITKGIAAAWIGTHIANSVVLSPLIMAAVVAGHIWPLQLGFRGGKGLAAGFGALLWLSPATAAMAAAVNVCLSLLVRSATLGSLASTALVPLFAYILGAGGWFSLLLAIPCGLVLFAHRSNLRLAMAAKFRGAGPW